MVESGCSVVVFIWGWKENAQVSMKFSLKLNHLVT